MTVVVKKKCPHKVDPISRLPYSEEETPSAVTFVIEQSDAIR